MRIGQRRRRFGGRATARGRIRWAGGRIMLRGDWPGIVSALVMFSPAKCGVSKT